MIFNYELRFVHGVHVAESLLLGRNFVSGICKVNIKHPKNLKTKNF